MLLLDDVLTLCCGHLPSNPDLRGLQLIIIIVLLHSLSVPSRRPCPSREEHQHPGYEVHGQSVLPREAPAEGREGRG